MGNRKYNFNLSYFHKITTPEQAYMLGLLYSDGCIYTDSTAYIIFGQVEDNKDIVEKFNKELKSTYPIHSELRGSKIYYYVRLTSKECYKDLIDLGLTPHKSLTIQFLNLSDNLLPSFILGCFDGDGCVWNGKRKVMKVKDSSRKEGYRNRIVHNVKITYTGNVDFVTSLQNILINKLGFKKTKLNFSKAKNPNNNTSFRTCTMEYSGRKQIKKFYDFIYKDSKLYGNTKKRKFEEIFCALDEKSSKDTSLIAGTPEMTISSQASCNNQEEGSSTIPEMGVESSDSKCEALNR